MQDKGLRLLMSEPSSFALEFEDECGVGGEFEREDRRGRRLGGGLCGGREDLGVAFGEKDVGSFCGGEGKRDRIEGFVGEVEEDGDTFVVVGAKGGKDLFLRASNEVDLADITASESRLLVSQMDEFAVERKQRLGVFGLGSDVGGVVGCKGFPRCACGKAAVWGGVPCEGCAFGLVVAVVSVEHTEFFAIVDKGSSGESEQDLGGVAHHGQILA